MRPVRFALASAAVNRSGSVCASTCAKRCAKSFTAGHSACDGDAFLDDYLDVRGHATLDGEHLGGTPHEVGAIGRHGRGVVADHPHGQGVRRRHREGVCQRQCLKNRRQLVIAVVSQVPDGKVEIHLGRGPDDYGAWNDGEHKEQQ